MKNNKTPFLLRKEVVVGISVMLGGIMGGLLCSMGQTSGEYNGATNTDNSWREAIGRMIDDIKNESKDEENEE